MISAQPIPWLRRDGSTARGPRSSAGVSADRDRPVPDRSGEEIAVGCDEGEFRDHLAPFAQTMGRLRVTAGAERPVVEGFDGVSLVRRLGRKGKRHFEHWFGSGPEA